MMNIGCEDVLIENLEACMLQRVTTSPTTIEASCNEDLPIVEGMCNYPFNSIKLNSYSTMTITISLTTW